MGVKLDRSSPKRVEIQHKEKPAEVRTPQQTQVSAQGNGTNQVKSNFFRDAFQAVTSAAQQTAAKLGGTVGTHAAAGTSSAGTVRPATLTPAEMQSAQQAIANAHDGRDASYVSDWLKNNPDPAKQAAFMDLMFQYESVAGEILDHSQNLPDADRQRLSQALDTAYRSGAVTNEELTQAVSESFRGAAPGESHEGLAEIVAGTGNPDLIETYARRELEIVQASDSNDVQRSAAAATALAGLPPDRLQAFLKDNAAAVGDMLKYINADPNTQYSPALGKLLDAASRITPPTAESVKLFNDSIDKIGDNVSTREAAARFFTQHGDAVLASMQDASGSLGLDGQKKMSEFFTRTLFSPPAYEGQDAFRQSVMTRLGAMNDDLARYANASPPPADAKRDARLMGSLVGALEGGFQVAVDELKKRNDAVEGMVGLLFSAKELLPDLPIPGAGKLKDLTIDQLQKWVTSSLQEKAQDASDAIPFHRAFGELIANPDLRTDYDAARGDAFLNRQRGLS
jgi:hypothetical protein